MVFKRHKGFTLIELLVVIVLLGIVSSFAVLSLNITGLDSELKEETRKIHALINLAKEEAIIHAKEISFAVEKNTYVFMYWGEEGTGKNRKSLWKPLNNKIFRKRTVHKGLKILLETEQKFSFEKEDDEKFNSTIFASSGEQSEFVIKVYIENDRQSYYLITGKDNGDVIMEKNNGNNI